MKFTCKLVVLVTTIIAVIFSIAGSVMVEKNFKHSLESEINQNTNQHFIERYGIENTIVNNITEEKELVELRLIEYAKSFASYVSDNRMFSIFLDSERKYSNIKIPLDESDLDFLIASNDPRYLLKDIQNSQYMLVSSTLEINNQRMTLLSVYDITKVFEERDTQILTFYMIDIVIMIVSTISISLLSYFLTKPIVTLNEVSKKISKGTYSERIDIQTNDEIGELGKSFNKMVETIENKMEQLNLSVKQREEFVSNFTHELKTPLTSIIGYSDILRSNTYNDDTKVKAANYIFSEAKRLEILSHKLMDLMELSNEYIIFDKINTKDFFKKIENDLKENSKGTDLYFQIEECLIMGDQVLLENCFRNLIDNAIKSNATHNEVLIIGALEANQYKVAIIDQGCGIAKTDIERITESFYMVDKARSKSNGGSGIGLSICKKIAFLHKTDLYFESEVAKGTTVTMYLEVEDDEA